MASLPEVVADVIEALCFGQVGTEVDDLDVRRRDDGSIVADYGDVGHYFVVTIRQVRRD
jgi:hypothetical protein